MTSLDRVTRTLGLPKFSTARLVARLDLEQHAESQRLAARLGPLEQHAKSQSLYVCALPLPSQHWASVSAAVVLLHAGDKSRLEVVVLWDLGSEASLKGP